MGHVIEAATSGRAGCRGCGKKIAKDELRFGERQPNAFGDGEMTLWLHLRCAALKRPEPLLETLAETDDLPDAKKLDAIAKFGADHRRVPRIDGAS
ncbi:MAG: PARP-type zinc finger-containing protein, partial [Gammaproteobacteria bacterium]|nr:PARP-type zinc finger-containing protein [Gammaproteobacteria bacterium]